MTTEQWIAVGFAAALFLCGLYLLVIQRAVIDSQKGKVKVFSLRAEGPVGLVLMILSAGLLITAFTALRRESTATNMNPPTPVSQGRDTSSSPVASSSRVTSSARVIPASPTSAPAQHLLVKVNKPDEGQAIAGQAGAVVTGVAQGLGDNHLWIFDTQTTDTQLYRDNEQPIAVASDGTWSFQDRPIGVKGTADVGQSFIIEVVLASPSCNQIIANQPANSDGDVVFDSLPEGCREVGHRTVVKTAP